MNVDTEYNINRRLVVGNCLDLRLVSVAARRSDPELFVLFCLQLNTIWLLSTSRQMQITSG